METKSIAKGKAEPDTVFQDEGIDLLQVLRRLRANVARILAIALIATVLGAAVGLLAIAGGRRETKMRVAFYFPGVEKGRYPDGSNFSADDLRAPDLIAATVQKRGLKISEADKTDLRASISVVGIVPPTVIKERDRLRASGQVPPLYIPEEYEVSLSGREIGGLDARERRAFLIELVSSYQDKFKRTYANSPQQFGNVFEQLSQSDYLDYETVVNDDLRGLSTFLSRLIEDTNTDGGKMIRTQAATFRSQNTGLSFADLLGQTSYFWNVVVTQDLSVIQGAGLSKDRQLALLKMDYRVRILDEEEKRLGQEEALVQELMSKAEARSQNYVLGIKSQNQPAKADAPLIDQGLLDSLVQNDAYNFLVRRALDVGVQVRTVQAQKMGIIARKAMLEKSLSDSTVAPNLPALRAKADEAIRDLRVQYKQLWDRFRITYEDYTSQQLANTIRLVQDPVTIPVWQIILGFGLVGFVLGIGAAIGLSILNVLSSRASLQANIGV